MSDNRNNQDLSFLDDLSEAQKKAVIYCNSQQLVLSSAGSGKTRILIYKIAYLIKKLKIPSNDILALTFTKKAANEMRERISKLIGVESSKNICMGTFYSIFYNILKQNISYLRHGEYNKNFQIINESEVKKMIKKILSKYFSNELNEIFQKNNININNEAEKSSKLKKLIHVIIKKIMILKN